LKILFGGAWRQAGVLAAAGLIALEEGPKRLHDDHTRARRLAAGVAEILPGALDASAVETNMVYVDTEAVGLPTLRAVRRLEDLEVSGLVENPFTLSYRDLRGLPTVKVGADMHCVTGWTTLDNEWEGVSFRTLVERAKPKPEAKWVIAHCAYGYTSNLSLAAMDHDDVLVAWRNGGQDLAPEHGWPLRLVVPKRYAWK